MLDRHVANRAAGREYHYAQIQIAPDMRGFLAQPAENPLQVKTVWRTEVNSNCRYRFSKLSYDSIMLGFVIETGCEALLPDTAFLARFSFCRWKRRS
jgi:hypothetical protein